MAEAVADAEVTHLLITDEERYGLSAESPQVPGLCFGRPTETEFRADYMTVLEDVGVRGRVVAHRQWRRSTEDGREYIKRLAEGPDMAERLDVLHRIEALISIPEGQGLLDNERTPMGEVVFAAAMPSDALGFFMDQLYEADDALVLCAPVADTGVFTLLLVSGLSGRAGHPDWLSIADRGWSRDTPISQVLMESVGLEGPQRLTV